MRRLLHPFVLVVSAILLAGCLIDADDFRDFTFANAVRFFGTVNPDFFKGTAVEGAAASVLAHR